MHGVSEGGRWTPIIPLGMARPMVFWDGAKDTQRHAHRFYLMTHARADSEDEQLDPKEILVDILKDAVSSGFGKDSTLDRIEIGKWWRPRDRETPVTPGSTLLANPVRRTPVKINKEKAKEIEQKIRGVWYDCD